MCCFSLFGNMSKEYKQYVLVLLKSKTIVGMKAMIFLAPTEKPLATFCMTLITTILYQKNLVKDTFQLLRLTDIIVSVVLIILNK